MAGKKLEHVAALAGRNALMNPVNGNKVKASAGE
jgi:hypothetical protein